MIDGEPAGVARSPRITGSRREPAWRTWILVFVVALAARASWGIVSLARADPPSALEFPDEEQYWLMADSLRGGEGLKDELGFRATRMPLYPALLSLCAAAPRGIIVAKVSQWILGATAAVLAAGVAGRLFGPRVGLPAGLLVALDPFLVFFSSLLLTETGSVTALVGLAWLLGPIVLNGTASMGRWFAVGAVASLNVYFRESSLGLVLLMLGFVVAINRFDRRTLLGAVLAATLLVVSLFPWALRNRRVLGESCWLTTRAGISLYDGVRPGATGRSDLGAIKQMPAVRGLSEVEWNRYFLNESFRAIQDDPRRIILLMGTKLARLWNPFPNVATHQSRLKRTVSAAWTVPTFGFAIAGTGWLILSRRRDGLCLALFLLLPALYFSALHSLFVGSVRYRLGAVPFLEILAAVAVVALMDRARPRAATGESTRAD